jgi:uncharacterized HAD superfamily protein
MVEYDVAFDLDDVVFETSLPLLNRCKELNFIPDTFEFEDISSPVIHDILGLDQSKIENQVLSDEFFIVLKPIKQSIDCINNLLNNNIKVCFITARMVSHAKVTYDAVESIGFNPRDVFFCRTSQKAVFAKQLGVSVIIDDRPIVAMNAKDFDIYALVPPMPYNKYLEKFNYDKIICGDWDNINSFLRWKFHLK